MNKLPNYNEPRGIGRSTDTPVPIQETEIMRESNFLDSSISGAFDVAQRLHKRLEPFLKNLPCNPVVQEKDPEECLCQFAAQIRRQRLSVQQTMNLLIEIEEALAI